MTHQLSRDDLAGMTPAQITEAHDAGRFNDLIGIDPADTALVQRASAPDIRHTFTATEVRRLRALGRHDLVANITIDQITE
ncbi:hypothetical protein [Microbacterium timonense]|uniref:hypothetical protein n=1 Tax=Microbacterium timonense TaxID=2086576 RepID=UPI000D0F6423|nr:hypothetical protein [Microbacterium timonense]